MRATDAERFWRRVLVDGDTACWEWQGGTNGRWGYGKFRLGARLGSRHVLVHRFAYETLVGPIPPGLQLDHLCRNVLCVNPQHLEPVTNRVNSLRGVGFCAVNAAKTHCPYGHPYGGANLAETHSGHRRCRACHREQSARRHASRRAATTHALI